VKVLIAGAGFCGSVIARKLAECGVSVDIYERRNHIAGNMYDEVDEHGIRVQRYGPHSVHTNSERVHEFLSSYGRFVPYTLTCRAEVNGRLLVSPFNYESIDFLFDTKRAAEMKSALKRAYPNATQATILELLDSTDPLIREWADLLYEEDYTPYTAKQWGISPEEIDKSVLRRVPVLFSYDDQYFYDKYQYVPEDGFTAFFKKLNDHPNITLHLNTDIKERISIDYDKKCINGHDGIVVYTGALDSLMDYEYGVLPYRSLRFDYQTKEVDSFQSAPVVAYPKAEGYTRITEYKKLPVQDIEGKSTVAYEYPLQFDPEDKGQEPYYPIPNDANAAMYQRYYDRVKDVRNLFICGRLADYKYYNMDNAIERALDTFDIIKQRLR
jgi:UDP-galactopyranose mutase